MSKSKRSLDEQIKNINELYLKAFEKAKQYEERKNSLNVRKKRRIARQEHTALFR